jgi:hypothetical protein
MKIYRSNDKKASDEGSVEALEKRMKYQQKKKKKIAISMKKIIIYQ